MFDDINFKMDCPECGTEVSGFQSKDGPCALIELEPDQVSNFYSSCKSCGAWIEFYKPWQERERRATPLSKEDVLSLGFVLDVRKKELK